MSLESAWNEVRMRFEDTLKWLEIAWKQLERGSRGDEMIWLGKRLISL